MIATKFKETVTYAMKYKKISKAQLAYQMNCTVENINQILTDGKEMRTPSMDKLCKILDIDVTFFIKGVD